MDTYYFHISERENQEKDVLLKFVSCDFCVCVCVFPLRKQWAWFSPFQTPLQVLGQFFALLIFVPENLLGLLNSKQVRVRTIPNRKKAKWTWTNLFILPSLASVGRVREQAKKDWITSIDHTYAQPTPRMLNCTQYLYHLGTGRPSPFPLGTRWHRENWKDYLDWERHLGNQHPFLPHSNHL